MRITKIALFTTLATLMALSSCKKSESTITFDNKKDVIIELTWTAKKTNGISANDYTYTTGHDAVDLDLYIDDANFNGGASGADFYSNNSGAYYESKTIPSGATSQKYNIGVVYWTNNITPASGYHYEISYTYKVYPGGNSGSAKYYNGTINTSATGSSHSNAYFSVSLDKSSSGYLFNSISQFTHIY